jgi:ribonuclease E
VPLFTRYQIESQIESAFAHTVTLPSGGSLVVDHTEALVSIDINSARATKGSDIEATALNTNLEAADEVGRQMRLRDLGGLLVIDFIDMGPQRNQRDVENRLRDAVHHDRARVQIGKISRFGLMEMSRQRLRPSLGESSYLTCPRCSGIGQIRSVESMALTILRIIGEEARKERTAKVIAQLPIEVATYLLNEKRDWVQSLESRSETQVILVANSALETPHYQIRRVRDDQVELAENVGSSYSLAESAEDPDVPPSMQERKIAEPAAVATVTPVVPAPKRKPKKKEGGFWAAVMALFSGSSEAKKKSTRGRQKPRGRTDGRKSSGSRAPRRGEQKRGAGDKRGNQRRKPAQKKTANKAAANDSQAKAKTGRGGRAAAGDKQQESQNEERKSAAKSGSKRRSRGGRRRRRSPNSEDGAASETNSTPQDSQANESPSQDSADSTPQAAEKSSPPKQDVDRDSRAKTPSKAADAQPAEQTRSQEKAKGTQAAADLRQRSGDTQPEIAVIKEPQAAKPEKAADERPAKAQNRAEEKPATEAKPAPAPQANPAAKAAPEADAKSEAKAVPAPKAKPETKAAAKSEAKPEAKPEVKQEAAAKEKPTRTESASSGNGESKPAGRLLPWEPAATPAKKTADDAPKEGADQ